MTKIEIEQRIFDCMTMEDVISIDDEITKYKEETGDKYGALFLWQYLFMVEEGISRDNGDQEPWTDLGEWGDTLPIGKIIDVKIVEKDFSIIERTEDMTMEEQIKSIEGMFEFEDDKTYMYKIIDEIKESYERSNR